MSSVSPAEFRHAMTRLLPVIHVCLSQRKPFLLPSNRMSGNITLTTIL